MRCELSALATAAAGPPHSLRSSAWVTPCGWPVRWCQAATRPLSSRRSTASCSWWSARPPFRARARRAARDAVALPLGSSCAHLVGLEQAGDAEEVHLLLRAGVHLALVAELRAVEEHVVEAGPASRAPRTDPSSSSDADSPPGPGPAARPRPRRGRPRRSIRRPSTWSRCDAPARRRTPAGWAPTAGRPRRSPRGRGPGRNGRWPGRRTAASTWWWRTPRRRGGARRRPPRPSGPRPSTGRRPRRSPRSSSTPAFSSESTTAGDSPAIRRAAWRTPGPSPGRSRSPGRRRPARPGAPRTAAGRPPAAPRDPVATRVERGTQACAVRSLVSGSPSRADTSSPARVRHRISPEYARKSTGRTTPSSAPGVAVGVVGDATSTPSAPGSYLTNGIGFSSERNGVPVSASRRPRARTPRARPRPTTARRRRGGPRRG